MGSPSHLFRQTITVAELTGRDAYGKPVMGPAATARARIQPLQKLIRDAKGQEVQATHVVYTDAALTLNSRVWFPGEPAGDFNRARRPLSIGFYVDGAGLTQYRKVWF